MLIAATGGTSTHDSSGADGGASEPGSVKTGGRRMKTGGGGSIKSAATHDHARPGRRAGMAWASAFNARQPEISMSRPAKASPQLPRAPTRHQAHHARRAWRHRTASGALNTTAQRKKKQWCGDLTIGANGGSEHRKNINALKHMAKHQNKKKRQWSR